jgi:hypothetical protein
MTYKETQLPDVMTMTLNHHHEEIQFSDFNLIIIIKSVLQGFVFYVYLLHMVMHHQPV